MIHWLHPIPHQYKVADKIFIPYQTRQACSNAYKEVPYTITKIDNNAIKLLHIVAIYVMINIKFLKPCNQ